MSGNGSVNSKPAHPPAPPAFVGHLSIFNNVANALQWGHLIRTNPYGRASGRVQMVSK